MAAASISGLSPEVQTPRDLLPLFYEKYGLDNDGGQGQPYVRIEFTKNLFLYFPNFDARRKAVFKHDVHHLATGYPSTFKGETEIGAWEIGSGCRKYWAAFLLDLQGMMAGLLFNFPGVFKAFLRGRRTSNLYKEIWNDEQLLDIPISQIRQELLLTSNMDQTKIKAPDLLLFLLVLLVGLIYGIMSLLLLPLVFLYSIYIHLIVVKA